MDILGIIVIVAIILFIRADIRRRKKAALMEAYTEGRRVGFYDGFEDGIKADKKRIGEIRLAQAIGGYGDKYRKLADEL